LYSQTVGELMTTTVISAAEGASVTDLAASMVRNHIRCVPIQARRQADRHRQPRM
jgi:CBS domain-containing protein